MELLKNQKNLIIWVVFLAVAAGVVYWPIVVPMVRQWAADDNYSHGFLVPFIAGYLVYMRRDDLLEAEVKPAESGMGLILFGLAMLLFGWLGTEYFTMRASLVVIIAGSVLYILGWKILGFSLPLWPICCS